MRTPEEWREISVDMFKRTEKLYNTMGMLLLMKLPTIAERKAIVDYLTSHAMKAADLKALPEPDSAGAVLFSARCSQCHILPDPGFHKAAEWNGVLDRMRKNMRTMRKPVISDDEAGKISAYLQKHS
jgi:cytochrome c5